MSDEEYFESVIRSEWFVCVNDEIGGWAIKTEPGPTSENKGLWVAEFITAELAEYVAEGHNTERARYVIGS